jgi:CRP-like cAMP-binding protein
MSVQLETIRKLPLFSTCDASEIGGISTLFTERTVARNQVILLEGEQSDSLMFLTLGAAKVFRTSSEGKEQILDILRPGDPLNDVPIFDGGPNPYSVQAMSPVTLYQISKADLDATLLRCPAMAQTITKSLASQVRRLMALVEELSFKHVSSRIARILLEYMSDQLTPKQRLTQQEMAAMAGTVREVVGRALKSLEEIGAIKLDRHRIIIADAQALKDAAGEG